MLVFYATPIWQLYSARQIIRSSPVTPTAGSPRFTWVQKIFPQPGTITCRPVPSDVHNQLENAMPLAETIRNGSDGLMESSTFATNIVAIGPQAQFA
ncbi:hypothetical protein ACEPAG_903 [Sanghuangporus baumii]